MKHVVLVAVMLALASPAQAIDRSKMCSPGQAWSLSLGACVKKKPAPKLSPQEKYDRANDDLDGRGAAPDPKRGIARLEEACTGGHGQSCTLLGFLYQRGRVVGRDGAKATQYFTKACGLDDLEGCYDIGDAAYQANQHAVARAAFVKACDLGSGDACVREADLIDTGVGGKPDPAGAQPYWKKSLELLQCPPNDVRSCFLLGFMFEHGKGVPKDAAKAIAAYRAGCDASSGIACKNLASALDSGLAGKPDPDAASAAYDKACNLYDDSDACQRAAIRLGNARKDLAHAFQLAKRACDLDTANCGTLGEYYKAGLGVAVDQTTATSWIGKACEAGNPFWCASYGERAHDGEGMTADAKIAQDAVERACQGGNAKGCRLAATYLGDGARAHSFATAGCDKDDGGACAIAADHLRDGKTGGGGPNLERALAMYEKACAHDWPAGCNAAGDAYRDAHGTTADPAKAEERFLRGCKGTDEYLSAPACESLGKLAYFKTPRDAPTAVLAFARACRYGREDPCRWMGSVIGESPAERTTAVDELAAGCSAKVEIACVAHASVLASGNGTDQHRAFEMFEASCKRGNDEACVAQADAYLGGRGVSANLERAEQLYRSRCDAGRAGACNGLSMLYEKQGKPDVALAAAQRACDAGWADGCNRVAYAYYTAKGARWDVVEAAKYYAKACDLNLPIGCSNQAELYRFGVAATPDPKKAFELYTKACVPSQPYGCAGLAHYLATGEGGATKDTRRAEASYRAACDYADPMPDACRELADLLDAEHRGSQAEIARYRTKAFGTATEHAKDNPYYMWLLGTFYRDGMATIRDPKQALAWFTKACDAYDPLGCVAAGTALRETGKPDDAERAHVYFERACAAGIDDGCKLVKPKASGPSPIGKPQGCCAIGASPGTNLGLALAVLAVLRRRRAATIAR